MTMWSNLLSGLIGGVVGGLLSVVAAFVGIRYERSQMRLDTSRVAVGTISKNILAIRTALDQAQWALDPESKSLPSAVDSPMATIRAAARSILYEYQGLIANPELRSRIDKLVNMVTKWYDDAEKSSVDVNKQGIESIDSYMGFVQKSIDAHRNDQPLPLDQTGQAG